MKIFIMRHGEAEHFAQSDAERELTQNGRSASVAVARACAERGFSQFDKVLVSPYVRAQQTWQEISNCFESEQVERCEDITPYGESEQVADYVSALIDVHQYQSILLVSHLPLVGYLTAEFVADIHPPMFPTSGLTCIEYSPEKRSGEILFNIQP
ncbi:phosphohistidine phosphatase SixA [Vibrio tubiashii]|uniref:Phosphohistidine phosphatase n=1 Tax=Vibrio tubiashii ATCC 19109 TaxID=1051646 RepID=F9TBB3_9VIBR|nr:phosphohistidine phosphatase SixA [Vibrio tubiashii]AIW13500.1 phosphohistidine phosphatase [Vibrio tubiashii ATCC 19109]EGU49130.1 phosphohistidine phosphatase [Vibrio tubiashii ATCC 19109]EIF04214.1 phosphohistidine phosphatase [Vibrio tubiashii NCIMB 1337 = ATCC 19106]